jgi:hypothetical protein
MDTWKIEQLLEKIANRLDSILDKVGDIERTVRLDSDGVTKSLAGIEFYLENINSGIGEVQGAIESLDLSK